MSTNAIIMIVSIVANIACFFWMRGSWVRWVSFSAAVLPLIFFVLVLIGNASAGCYPWSPKEIEFHQGMTICPGQSAVGRLIISPTSQPDRGI